MILQVLLLFVFDHLPCLVLQLLHTLEDILQFLQLKTFEILVERPKRLSCKFYYGLISCIVRIWLIKV